MDLFVTMKAAQNHRAARKRFILKVLRGSAGAERARPDAASDPGSVNIPTFLHHFYRFFRLVLDRAVWAGVSRVSTCLVGPAAAGAVGGSDADRR